MEMSLGFKPTIRCTIFKKIMLSLSYSRINHKQARDKMSEIQITVRHIEATDGIRQHVIDKFSKLDRYDEKFSHPVVVLSVDKGVHFAESKMHIFGHEVFAKCESHDLYQAIDAMVDKLDAQIHKLKSKLQDHHPKNKFKPDRSEEE